MRINNVTPFDTEVLRKIAQEVAERELDPDQRAGITVHFTVAKSRRAESREARRDGFYRRAQGKVPPRLKFNQAIVIIRQHRAAHDPKLYAMYAAHDLAHEFAEMRGLHHEQMKTPRYMYRAGWTDWYAWAEQYPLTFKAKPMKRSREDTIGDKLEHAEDRLKNAQRKERLAVTIRKKWQAKVRHYQKELAKATQVTLPVDHLLQRVQVDPPRAADPEGRNLTESDQSVDRRGMAPQVA
jgi:hypothetical protein